MCVHCVFAFTKAVYKSMSILDSFVKRTYDHQGEVTPSLITKENSWTWGSLRKAFGHPF